MAQGKPQYAFFEGKIVPIADAKVGVMTHALNYGTGVFGGLRGYWNEDEEQLFVFRPHDHFERFLQSANMMRIDLPYSATELVHILLDLLRTEGFRENCYIRPLAYKSTEMIGVKLHDVDNALTIFALPFGSYVNDKEAGLHVGFSSWRRVDDNAIPARGKVTGAYANSALIKTEANLAGYDEALVLNSSGHLSETSASNIFIVRKGVVITPPVYADVLEGITRRTIIHLLREEMGIEVIERDIDRTELYVTDEVFLCGTGVQIAAITQIEHRPVGNGVMGPITQRISSLYHSLVRGQVEKYREWLTPVYANTTEQA
ncbi:MAG: branched-chain amino acid transaminase [Anaerolineae bacterium]|nr:branched-chain amino acid transaminase [Anaerolineae bacterium]